MPGQPAPIASASLSSRIKSIPTSLVFFFLFFITAMIVGCYHTGSTASYATSSFRQVSLLSDTALSGVKIDKNLSNPWGIVAWPASMLYVADNHSGVATIYDTAGTAQTGSPIRIPGASDSMGAPTGVAYNGTSDFPMPDSSGKAVLIFAGEDGSISAWSSGAAAKIAVRPLDSTAVYKGLALASDTGRNFLYLANFRDQRVDVFNGEFHRDTSRAFRDPSLPAGYGPFNIAVMGNDLFVSYAKLKAPDNTDDEAGPGNGYIDVYGTNGSLIRRFASQGDLNSPWGMARMTGTFGPFTNGIFIGNFGDGMIHAYDDNGKELGAVADANGHPIQIDGLWSLLPLTRSAAGTPGYPATSTPVLYFTAGIEDENHGLFGYLLSQ